jgi:DnaJ-class molecular chaperone
MLKTCSSCHGTGAINEDGEEILCSNCGGSGEVAEKKVVKSTNPNVHLRSPHFPRK